MPVLLPDYQQDILTFRHLPYTPVGALEHHSFGHLEAAYPWLRQKSANTPENDEFYEIQGAVDAIGIKIRHDINNKLQHQSTCQKGKCKQQCLLLLIYQDNFKWDSTFFNMSSRFLVTKYLEGVAVHEIFSFAISYMKKCKLLKEGIVLIQYISQIPCT